MRVFKKMAMMIVMGFKGFRVLGLWLVMILIMVIMMMKEMLEMVLMKRVVMVNRIGDYYDRDGRISVADYDDAPMAMTTFAFVVSTRISASNTTESSCPNNSIMIIHLYVTVVTVIIGLK